MTVDAPAPRNGSRRLILQLGIVLLLVIAAIVVVVVVVSNNHAAAKHPVTSSAASPKNMASYGVLLTGSGGNIVTSRTPAVTIGHPVPTDTAKHATTVNIVEYVDYQCPYCLAFEEANLNNTAALVAAGTATLEIHPIAFLDASSEGTRYSSRADNAAACVANFDPDEFLSVTAALYEGQPKEGTPGLTNKQILSVLAKADVSEPSITKCVNSETYRTWVSATTAAVENGTFQHVAKSPITFPGTPTVFVNGIQYTGSITDAKAFSAFVAAES